MACKSIFPANKFNFLRWNSISDGETTDLPIIDECDIVLLQEPTDLILIPYLGDQINGSFTDNTAGSASHEVWWKQGVGGTFALLETLVPGDTTFEHDSLTEDQEYCYKVRASSGADKSAYTEVKCETTPIEFSFVTDANYGVDTIGVNQLDGLTNTPTWIMPDGERIDAYTWTPGDAADPGQFDGTNQTVIVLMYETDPTTRVIFDQSHLVGTFDISKITITDTLNVNGGSSLTAIVYGDDVSLDTLIITDTGIVSLNLSSLNSVLNSVQIFNNANLVSFTSKVNGIVGDEFLAYTDPGLAGQNFLYGTHVLTDTIDIKNNSMSTGQVNSQIDQLYASRALFDIGQKFFLIGTNNAAPTGTYQAPPGFILGVSDGTPTSQLEKVYVLVWNYNWVVTYFDGATDVTKP